MRLELDRPIVLIPLFAMTVLLFGCPPSHQAPREHESMMLEDLEPPAHESDEALRSAMGPIPMPRERPPFRAQPDDPRPASSLEDLEQRDRPQPTDTPPATPRPLPEEPRPPRPKG